MASSAGERSVSSSTSTGSDGPDVRRTGQGGRALGVLVSRWAVLGAYVVMVAIFALLRPETFLTLGTLKDLLNQAAVPVILACGVTFTVAVGEFDLSFPAIVSLAGGILVWLISVHGVSVPMAVAFGIVIALVSGLVVGSTVVFGGANSFIITLALASVLNGIEWSITSNRQIFSNIPEAFGHLTNASLLGFKSPAWFMLVTIGVTALLLHGTTFGRHLYAIGGNERAAFLAGVRIKAVRIACYFIVAACASLAAIIQTSTASSYYPALANGLLLSSFASLFLGAAMVASNRFTILGSAMGVVWLLTLQTGLTQLSQPAWVSTLVQGLVLAAAVLIAVRGRTGKTT